MIHVIQYIRNAFNLVQKTADEWYEAEGSYIPLVGDYLELPDGVSGKVTHRRFYPFGKDGISEGGYIELEIE